MDYPLMIESSAAAVGTLTVRSPYGGRKLAEAATGDTRDLASNDVIL